MSKLNLVLVIIVIVVILLGITIYKKDSNLSSVPTQYNPIYNKISPTPTPYQDINQQALDKELDQIDQIAKSIQDNNDKDSDLNNLAL